MKEVFVKIEHRFKLYSRYFLIIVAIVLSFSLIRSLIRMSEAGEKIVEAEEKVRDLELEHERLLDKLEEVESEKFVESQMRDKLGLVKEGEIVIVLPDEEILRRLAPEEIVEEDVLPPPNWKMWLDLFI